MRPKTRSEQNVKIALFIHLIHHQIGDLNEFRYQELTNNVAVNLRENDTYIYSYHDLSII